MLHKTPHCNERGIFIFEAIEKGRTFCMSALRVQ
jgi:hypothetical protein